MSLYKEKRKFTFNNVILQSLHSLFILFQVHGNFELYLVGGCVRDFLHQNLHQNAPTILEDRTPKDFDLCTNATPSQIKELIQTSGAKNYAVWDSGIKHGTVTITDSLYHTSFEITTYRSDGKYTDGRHPDKVAFVASLEEDLQRRDFTINSLAYNLLTQELFMLDSSYLLDIEFKVIKCVGYAPARFREDALRMLRAIRFAAQLGATINYETLAAIKENSGLITQISKERIRDELTKIICSDNPQFLDYLILTGLDFYIMHDLNLMKECEQKSKYHYTDVLHHTFDVIKALPKTDTQLRWAALFHDMGKPHVRTTDDDGYNHFQGHEKKSVERALLYMQVLKFDNDSIKNIQKIIEHHDAPLMGTKMSTFKKLVLAVGEDLFSRYLQFRAADAHAHVLQTSTDTMLAGLSTAKERYKKILLEKHTMTLKQLAINGNDLIALGYQGKDIGRILNSCLEFVLENSEYNIKDLLITYIKNTL